MSKKTSTQDPFAEREASNYERPIPSREFILEHLKKRGEPANYQTLLEELDLKEEEEQEALHRRIKAMLRDLQLERLHGGFFWPAEERSQVEGRIQIEKGKNPKVWLIPVDESPKILIPYRESRGVYQGNRVIATVAKMKESDVREGRITEILEQQLITVTGRFGSSPNGYYVIPHSKEFPQEILIPKDKTLGAKEGDIVVVELTSSPLTHWSEPSGEVIEILGHEDNSGIEILSATHAYGLPDEWPEEVLQEVKGFAETIPEASKKGRLDLCHLPLVTIDGEDAKDFDDAVFCERTKNGWTLYVAIADVSSYVKPESALDEEARIRGNSVYFPGKVIPMLPEVLSNGLCSLKPDVERLVLVCILNISEQGQITDYKFHEAVILSHARLTYTKVAQMLQGNSEVLTEQYKDIFPHLQELHRLYLVLKSEREKRGAIEFETSETRIIFGENGKISRIEPIQRNDAHRLIEECMLAANVATAKFLTKHKLPGLYRIHEGPSAEKLTDLRLFLKELGLSLSGGEEPTPLDYAKLLASIQTRQDANVIQVVLLRSLSQAVYSPDNNVGHFGLAYPAYSHFTSPIRRYPDLWVHRQIRLFLQHKWNEKQQDHAHTEEAQAALIKLGEQCSMTERRADDATRDVVRWLKCEYIQKHIGSEFEGIISGVTRFGFFVELKDIYIDGLVHIAHLGNDYYTFDAAHHRLVGERSGQIFRLGDLVKVRVAKVDVAERKIDFELLSGGKDGDRSNSPGADRGRSKNRNQSGESSGQEKKKKKRSGKPRKRKAKK